MFAAYLAYSSAPETEAIGFSEILNTSCQSTKHHVLEYFIVTAVITSKLQSICTPYPSAMHPDNGNVEIQHPLVRFAVNVAKCLLLQPV
jgi:hypothetical protein